MTGRFRRHESARSELARALACCVLAAACSPSEKPEQSTRARPPKDEQILATVNGRPISRDDVDRAIKHERDPSRQAELRQPDQRSRLLDELVKRKAIAIAQEKALAPDDKQRLEAAVANERDEMLARKYIEKRVRIDPVTEGMVEQYYREHPERFGAGTRKQCEVLTTDRPLNDAERQRLAQLLVNPATHADWAAWATELKLQGFPVVHRSGVPDSRLHPSLREQIEKLAVNQVSGPRFVFGSPYVLRVTGEEKQAPRPREEVAHQIRTILGPAQLTKAVERASQQALKQVKVEYADAAK